MQLVPDSNGGDDSDDDDDDKKREIFTRKKWNVFVTCRECVYRTPVDNLTNNFFFLQVSSNVNIRKGIYTTLDDKWGTFFTLSWMNEWIYIFVHV
jgi:hypothetical protein